MFHRSLRLLSIAIVAAFTNPAAAENSSAITSINDLRSIAPQQITTGSASIPIELVATVTYADPLWNLLYVVQDQHPILVVMAPFTNADSVTRGSEISLRGYAITNGSHSAVQATHIRHLADSPLPEPRGITTLSKDPLHLPAEELTLTATIVSTLVHSGHTLVHARSGETHFRVVIAEELPLPSPDSVSGFTVRITGTMAKTELDPTAATAFTLFTQSLSQFAVVSPPPPGFEPPHLIDATDLLSDGQSPVEPGSPILLTGTAIHVTDLHTMWIGESGKSILATCANGTYGIAAGDTVTMSGTYALLNGEPAIHGVSVTAQKISPPMAPQRFTVSRLVSTPPAPGSLITIAAELEDVVPSPDARATRFHLADESAAFVVQVPLPPSQLSSLELETATRVALTGLLRRPPGSGDQHLLEMLPRSTGDITVIARDPKTLSLLQLAWPGSLVFVASLLTLAWVSSLRRQVSRHTAELHQKTDRLSRSEAQLATTTARLRAVHNSVREAILVTCPDGHVLDANIHFSQFFALPHSPHALSAEELPHQLASTVADPHHFSQFWQSLVADPSAEGQLTITAIQHDQKKRELEAFTAPVFLTTDGELAGRVWVFRDVTEQLALEERLLHAQKMEAVGRLSAGIAHDFNNLLTGISGSISIARLRPERRAIDIEEHLQTAASAAHRAKDLVHRLLGFSRQSNLHLAPACANEIVSKAASKISQSLPPSITLKTVIAPSLWLSRIDTEHLSQVIHDLCSNARDALPSGGTITLTTRNTRHSRAPRSPRIPCVEITVSDDGIGIPADRLQQVFEPFFTTKEQGKGTGLGLAMSFGVVEQHGGWMTCRSTEGLGTSVSIFLPRHAEQKPPKPKPDPNRPKKKTKPTSKLCPGHVLIIDDEPVVRSVSEGIFRHHNFEVSTANNGREGLDWLAANPGEAHIVILDLTMPVLSGKETLREIRSSYPGLPVVIASGYLIDLDAFAAEVGSYPDAFVQKPFDVTHILQVVRDTLKATRHTTQPGETSPA